METACCYWLLIEHGRFPHEFLELDFSERAAVSAFIKRKIKADKKYYDKIGR